MSENMIRIQKATIHILTRRLEEAVAEVERLRKLEAAVVGSWMEACKDKGPWHKALRYPCVELGYLVLEGHTFELAEEYQEMAKEWIRQKMVEIYGEDWDEE